MTKFEQTPEFLQKLFAWAERENGKGYRTMPNVFYVKDEPGLRKWKYRLGALGTVGFTYGLAMTRKEARKKRKEAMSDTNKD